MTKSARKLSQATVPLSIIRANNEIFERRIGFVAQMKVHDEYICNDANETNNFQGN
jgi:hypothetical protein